MPAKEIVTPTSFIETRIMLDKELLRRELAFTRSLIWLSNERGELLDTVAVSIGRTQVITVKPGKYQIKAVLGDIMSEAITIELEPGQTETLVFRFGKPV